MVETTFPQRLLQWITLLIIFNSSFMLSYDTQLVCSYFLFHGIPGVNGSVGLLSGKRLPHLSVGFVLCHSQDRARPVEKKKYIPNTAAVS